MAQSYTSPKCEKCGRQHSDSAKGRKQCKKYLATRGKKGKKK